MDEITLVLTDHGYENILNVLNNMPWDGSKQVVFRDYKSKRSLEQNALWHRMIGQLAQKMSYTPEEMKCIVKYALGYYHTIQGKKDVLIVYNETHKMSVEELSKLIDETIEWGAGKGVTL